MAAADELPLNGTSVWLTDASRDALDVARAVTTAALRRPESRGAHQRDDHPGLRDAFADNQTLHLEGDEIVSTFGVGDLGARSAA